MRDAAPRTGAATLDRVQVGTQRKELISLEENRPTFDPDTHADALRAEDIQRPDDSIAR